jgi:hypothetical protein
MQQAEISIPPYDPKVIEDALEQAQRARDFSEPIDAAAIGALLLRNERKLEDIRLMLSAMAIDISRVESTTKRSCTSCRWCRRSTSTRRRHQPMARANAGGWRDEQR